MNNKNEILNDVLNSREMRASLRSNFVENNLCTLSVSLNIPGYPKSNPEINSFFKEVLKELNPFLVANIITVKHEDEVVITDNAGDFFIVPLICDPHTLTAIKELTETFEFNHSVGRLIDIDIFNNQGLPVSSGKKKPCYFCGEFSAVSCMRNKRHSYEEIRAKLFNEVNKFLKNKKEKSVINKLTSFATKAILYEISLSPKPGLVSFSDTGSHTDMNFFTFLNSSASLTPFFTEFCNLGYHFSGDYKNALPQIREIGLRAETAMFSATKGVNTHKGIVFLFGLSLFSIAKLLSEKDSFNDNEFRKIIKKICKGIVANELVNDGKQATTHGEKVYQKYGLKGAGVRQEVEDAFPSVFHQSLSFFNKNLNSISINNEYSVQQILQKGMLYIMTVNNDSNILYRSNLETLKEFQILAQKAIDNNDAYTELCKFCLTNNISPGGSADLLSVALLLHFVKTEQL